MTCQGAGLGAQSGTPPAKSDGETRRHRAACGLTPGWVWPFRFRRPPDAKDGGAWRLFCAGASPVAAQFKSTLPACAAAHELAAHGQPVLAGVPKELNNAARRAQRGQGLPDDGPRPHPSALLPDCVWCRRAGVQNLRVALGLTTEHVERMQRAKKAIETLSTAAALTHYCRLPAAASRCQPLLRPALAVVRRGECGVWRVESNVYPNFATSAVWRRLVRTACKACTRTA